MMGTDMFEILVTEFHNVSFFCDLWICLLVTTSDILDTIALQTFELIVGRYYREKINEKMVETNVIFDDSFFRYDHHTC